MINVHQFPCLADNYGFLVRDSESGETAAIDTPDADAILAAADEVGWRITQIWNTHWHRDHAGGNSALAEKTGARVIGPEEVRKIAQAPDRIIGESDVVSLGAASARVLAVGGHTLGHLAYVFDADRVAFVGDTLFSLGCGRLFEGTPQQMWASLQKIASLPENTLLYCAHEYTASNARFAVSVDPENEALRVRAAEVTQLRAAGKPTVPVRLGDEKATNPFLRAHALKERLGMADAADWEAFGALRRQKDTF